MKWTDTGGKEFEQAPIGNHAARCVSIIDLGTQEGEWQGKPLSRRQVVLQWELPDELMEDGRPFLVSKFYTASLSDKANLRHDLEAWRGREFTPEELGGFASKNILDKGCMVQIIHTEKKKAKVANVAALPKSVQLPPRANGTLYFSLDEFDPAIYAKLGKYWQEQIAKSPEYKKLTNGAAAGEPPPRKAAHFDDFESDIPF